MRRCFAFAGLLGTASALISPWSLISHRSVKVGRKGTTILAAEASLETKLKTAEATIAAQSKRLADIERYFVTGTWNQEPPASLKQLCELSKEACDAMTPMIKVIKCVCRSPPQP